MSFISDKTSQARALVNRYIGSQYTSGILMAIAQSTLALVFILLDFFYSKILTVAELGDWKLMYMILGLATPLLSFGLPEGYKYHIARYDNKPLYFSNFLYVFFAIALVELLIIAVLNLLHYYDVIDIQKFYLISFLFPLVFLSYGISQVFKFTYINQQRIARYSGTIVACMLVTVLLILVSVYFKDFVRSHYMIIGVVFQIITFGLPIYWLFSFSTLKIKRSYLDTNQVRNMLRIGIPLYLATFMSIINVNLNKGIVSLIDSKEAFAIFSVGAFEIPIFAMLSAAFSQNIYPVLVKYMSEGNRKEAKQLWISTTKKVSFLTYPFLLLMMLFSKQIIFFVYTAEYAESVFLFQTFLLVGLLRNNFYGSLIVASGKTKFITLYTGMGLATNLVCSLSMYYFFGLKGMVFGNLIASFTIDFLQLNHEGLVRDYFTKFIFDKRILLLVIAILGTYFYNVFM